MLKYSPSALETGLALAVALFGLLLLANWPTITADIAVRGDHAADILLTERATHDWLLTGHYDRYGVHHPGPFFLYLRLIGQWLVGGWPPTIFGAQLVGVLACNAAFAGLFAAIIHRLARREEGCAWAAAGAATVALILVAMQFSFPPHDLPRPGYNIRGTFAAFWMPEAIILPFLTFTAASVLLLQGSVLGLIAATLCAAALVHGYMTMPLIVGPVWLVAVTIGERTRRAVTGCGFSPTAWFGVVLIITLFVLPLIADAILNPPGNIWAILSTAAQIRQDEPLLTNNELLHVLGVHWLGIRQWLWLAVLAGITIFLVTRRYRRLLRDGIIVTALLMITSALTYSQTPSPPLTYPTRFFEATALLPISFGAMLVILELARHRLIFVLAGVGVLLALFPRVASLYTPYRNAVEVSAIAHFIAAENTPGSRIKIEATARPGVIAGIFLELDKLAIDGCSTNQGYSNILTPERICTQSPLSDIKTYRFLLEPCPVDTEQLSKVTNHSIIVADAKPPSTAIRPVCFHVVRL